MVVAAASAPEPDREKGHNPMLKMCTEDSAGVSALRVFNRDLRGWWPREEIGHHAIGSKPPANGRSDGPHT